jgi:hypothetical protein
MIIPIHSVKGGSNNVGSFQGLAPEGAQTFKLGSPVRLVSGLVEEHPGTTTVTGILGFAAQAVTGGVPETVDDGQVTIDLADGVTVFGGQCVNGNDTVLTDLSSIAVGTRYGLLKRSDGFWAVDIADTTNVVVQITKVVQELNQVEFQVIQSARADG